MLPGKVLGTKKSNWGQMIICGTGHRQEDCEDEKVVRFKINRTLQSVPDIDFIITGMANGYDLWLGTEALRIGLPVLAAKPWTTHGPRKSDADLYAEIIADANEIVNVTDAETYPGPWVYHKRNEWMVDNSDRVLAYHSGKQSGGTFACITYAAKVGKKVRNIYDMPPF